MKAAASGEYATRVESVDCDPALTGLFSSFEQPDDARAVNRTATTASRTCDAL
jgi:hypothetical protein